MQNQEREGGKEEEEEEGFLMCAISHILAAEELVGGWLGGKGRKEGNTDSPPHTLLNTKVYEYVVERW